SRRTPQTATPRRTIPDTRAGFAASAPTGGPGTFGLAGTGNKMTQPLRANVEIPAFSVKNRPLEHHVAMALNSRNNVRATQNSSFRFRNNQLSS
ncbi:hypothetical protein, partial [Burkholderia glumae]|uniref:hypothetical protein n=1 Tax=Burkholderia glumae TaxID=337 RepID=UPI001E497130